jgi:hypothetical protein
LQDVACSTPVYGVFSFCFLFFVALLYRVIERRTGTVVLYRYMYTGVIQKFIHTVRYSCTVEPTVR